MAPTSSLARSSSKKMTMVLMAIDAGADAHRTPHKAQYPDNAGWIVRTGETYTYDTPYHKGNSPNPKGSSPSASLCQLCHALPTENLLDDTRCIGCLLA